MIRETKYHYTDQGEGEVVVLLHGFTGTVNTWDTLTTKLLDNGFRIICIDLIGHGKTETNSDHHTMESVCRDLSILFKSIDVNKCTIIGYSQGGRVALSFAQYFPEMVDKLVLESASPGIKDQHERNKRKINDDELARRILDDGLEVFVNKWEKTPLFGTQRSLDESTRQKIRQERRSQSEKGLALALTTIGTGRQPSWWDKLSTIKCPVLLIVGKQDEKFVKINKQMNTLLPCSRIELVTGSGHAVHIEKPTVFNGLVKQFLNE